MKGFINVFFTLRDRKDGFCRISKSGNSITVYPAGHLGGTDCRICRIAHEVEKPVEFKSEFHPPFVDNGDPKLSLGYCRNIW